MATITPRYAVYPETPNKKTLTGWQVKIRKQGFPAQSKTFRSKVEAKSWAMSVETDMERGHWRDQSEADATTLHEALTRYADEVIPRKKAGNRELGFIRQWQTRAVAEISLSRIRSKDIVGVIKEMENEGKAPKTISLHLGVVSHLFSVAVSEWGMEGLNNPVQIAKARKPKLPQGRDRRLIDNEETMLLDECRKAQTPWLLPVVRFAIETAMRAGEILETKGTTDPETGERPVLSTGLLWKHVDMKKQTAFLPETKNGEPRTVPLSSTAMEVLKSLPRSMNGKVFDTTYEAIHLSFSRTCKRAGIKGLHFHDLRHEATSRLFEKGLNPMQVSSITGHKTLQMLKRYTHLKAEDLVKLLG
ncbi:integrase [Acidithiobacillus marinus]|uniref:Integrase n=1 Tax=Acidithiobacillus marinus TaxID=187490 RepID=A0A2I1DN68_9PROT|nr:site-specific integrase [Acidithiobacillus marinus]PKY11323.1 integrase [Acidithiobacillus marinus]